MEVLEKNKRVLIVDDDPDMARSLELYLRMEGLEVIIANNGVRAMEELVINKPGVVILDALMPFMNGYEVCRRIREKMEDQDTAVIFLTGYPDRVKKEDMLKAGATAYLTKPCDFERLLSVIQDHI